MTIIDKETWPRREVYDFFAGMSHPFYSLTFPVDVTPLRDWCRKAGVSCCRGTTSWFPEPRPTVTVDRDSSPWAVRS